MSVHTYAVLVWVLWETDAKKKLNVQEIDEQTVSKR